MTGLFCPFKVFGVFTKCHEGKPYRDYDIKEKDGCMAWSETADGYGYCRLLLKDQT